MPHICGDEIMAFMMAVPVLGFALTWAKNKYRAWRKR